jgi:hypothetical protein
MHKTHGPTPFLLTVRCLTVQAYDLSQLYICTALRSGLDGFLRRFDRNTTQLAQQRALCRSTVRSPLRMRLQSPCTRTIANTQHSLLPNKRLRSSWHLSVPTVSGIMKELSQPDTTTRRVQTRWAVRPVIGFSIHPLLSREAELLRLLQELALLRQRDACDWAAGHANMRARDALHLLLRLERIVDPGLVKLPAGTVRDSNGGL